MQQPMTREQILDMAIEKELLTAQLFARLASEQQDERICKLLYKYARKEWAHKYILEKVKKGLRPSFGGNESVMSLNLAEGIDWDQIPEQMTDEHALMLAVKVEHAAYLFYMQLAGACQEEELVDLFISLARQEAKHRFLFEKVYSKGIRRKPSVSGSINVT